MTVNGPVWFDHCSTLTSKIKAQIFPRGCYPILKTLTEEICWVESEPGARCNEREWRWEKKPIRSKHIVIPNRHFVIVFFFFFWSKEWTALRNSPLFCLLAVFELHYTFRRHASILLKQIQSLVVLMKNPLPQRALPL